VDCSRVEYAEPIVPADNADESMVRDVGADVAAATTRETVAVADCGDEPESFSVTPKE
jgi:hypothetical protein